MSHAEQQEQGERLTAKGQGEASEIKSADAQAARNAQVSDVRAAQALNPDRHSGSAGGDQNESIEIVAVGRDGTNQVLARRQEPLLTAEELAAKAQKGDLWAQKFDHDLEQLNKLPAGLEREQKKAEVMKAASFVFRPDGKPDKSELAQNLMDTGTMLAAEATINPAAEPVKLLKEWVEKQPESPQKEAFRQEVRQQAADLSPEMKARMEHLEALRRKIDAAGLEDGGTHQAIRPEQLVLQGQAKYQENEWDGFNRLDPKQQRAIIEAFGKASDVAQDSYKSQIQAVSESVPKGFYNVGKGLYDSGIAACTFMIEAAQRPEKVPEAAHKLADNLSTAIISGVKISQVIAGYSQEVAQSGDYSRPLRDLQTVTTLANERWEAMPLEKRTEKASELVAEMGIGSVIGAAHGLAKSGKLIDALEDLAKYAKDLTAPGRDKAKQAIGKFLEGCFQPKGQTTNGFEMPIPKQQPDIDDLAMHRNKGLPDDAKPSEQVTSRRNFTPSGEQIHQLNLPDKVFQAAEARGFSRQVVQEKLNKVAQALSDSYLDMGEYNPKIHGSERAYGSRLHELLRRNLGADDLIHTEASYKQGLPVPWGKLGSSRVDIALGEHEKPFVSMCLKTLGAVPSAQQERGWYRNLPRLDNESVIPRIFFKLGK